MRWRGCGKSYRSGENLSDTKSERTRIGGALIGNCRFRSILTGILCVSVYVGALLAEIVRKSIVKFAFYNSLQTRK